MARPYFEATRSVALQKRAQNSQTETPPVPQAARGAGDPLIKYQRCSSRWGGATGPRAVN
eukprot:scaffold14724_cov31-Phaeocystis_antarctica.AAC.2